jgi:DNA modification methylase
VEALHPAARRLRSHPGWKRRTLEENIAQIGILDPITVNRANVIVDGHLRFEIARKLGLRTVPVIRIEHLSDEELRVYAIGANKLPSVISYDEETLRLELEEIRAEAPTLDLTATGFTIGELDRISGNHAANLYDDLDTFDEPQPRGPAHSKRGQLFALGEHRLLCGDSLDASIVARLMGSDGARCCFTDPPYNVKINGHVSSSGQHSEFAMASGEMSRQAFEEFLQGSLGNVAAHMVDGAIVFICMDHAHIGELLDVGDRLFDTRLNLCVWDKGRGGMGALYRSQHELVAVFRKGDAAHLNNVELGKNGRNRTNIWSFPGMGGFGKGRRKALELHPTMKPVALVAEALLDVTAPGDIVLDPFGGSGTTLIAAERIGRRARLIEYDPLYVDCTITRWERMSGKTAELISVLEDGGVDVAIC